MTFRARLMLLLTSFLLLTIALVLALDNWARKRAEEVIAEQNKQVTESVNSGYDDFLEAMSLAQQSLASDNYLYQVLKPENMPRTVESLWAITKVVRPVISVSSASCTSRSDSESSELVASSSIRIRGSFNSALAIAMRWR